MYIAAEKDKAIAVIIDEWYSIANLREDVSREGFAYVAYIIWDNGMYAGDYDEIEIEKMIRLILA
jgi:hypothetical protein